MEPDLAVSKVFEPEMAAEESPLDEPLLVPGKDEEQRGSGGGADDDVANMEAQLLLHHDTGASFWRSCLNLSNVISGTITNVRHPPPIFLIRVYDD